MTENKVYQYIMDGEHIYSSRTERDIERNRKGDFDIVITNQNGDPVKNAKVAADMSQIDFNFGANIFMLGEYDTDEENKRYERKFCKIFNSASVPLYWEGTEPTQGYLRYDADTKRDIYRRPPADAVRDFCRKHNLRMKGHPLFWHEFVPMWLPDDFSELKPLIVKRFEEISERYSKDFERFDVVNEPSRIYDVYIEHLHKTNWKCLVPDDDYIPWLFRLADRYFPSNTLILNDTVGASFDEFRGKYSAYYLNIASLLERGIRIDEIGLQCHLGGNWPRNVYNTEILYDILDTYASLGKPMNISEISIPSVFDGIVDEELQAVAAERLYKTCFSHPSISGLTWWNLPDDGVLTTKRVAANENLPSTGLIDGDYNEKPAYKVLDRLINHEWKTNIQIETNKFGIASFRGFYGKYNIKITVDGKEINTAASLCKNGSRVCKIRI